MYTTNERWRSHRRETPYMAPRPLYADARIASVNDGLSASAAYFSFSPGSPRAWATFSTSWEHALEYTTNLGVILISTYVRRCTIKSLILHGKLSFLTSIPFL